MRLREAARMRARRMADAEIAEQMGWSVETLLLLASSDAFKALEREEVIRAGIGGHDGS